MRASCDRQPRGKGTLQEERRRGGLLGWIHHVDVPMFVRSGGGVVGGGVWERVSKLAAGISVLLSLSSTNLGCDGVARATLCPAERI